MANEIITNKINEVINIEITSIREWDKYIRKSSESDPDVKIIAQSIQRHGLQYPIQVYENNQGEYLLVDGLKRLNAYKILGEDTIPAICVTKDPLISSWVSNMERTDLTPLQKSEYLEMLEEELNLPNRKDLAEMFGKSESLVTQLISLRKLPKKIKDHVRNSSCYGISTLYKLSKLDDTVALEKFENYELARKKKEEAKTVEKSAQKRDEKQVKAQSPCPH